MEIRIGENIKRLRNENSVTQEQLAEAIGVSTVAVSKWERHETMPDISLLPALAYYFKVSIDELMSYDEVKVDREIEDFILLHNEVAKKCDIKKCKALSEKAYKKYPNDYRVMELYMWDIVGGYADNDKKVILDHYEEIDKICDRILEGCKDTFIRNDACVMKGKLLFAKGKKQEAIDLYKNSLPDWYQTSGQKIEQLFNKDTEEFASTLKNNMFELFGFALNKKSKEIWFCEEGTIEEKTDRAVQLCKQLKSLTAFLPKDKIDQLISGFASDFELKLRTLAGAGEESLSKIRKYM